MNNEPAKSIVKYNIRYIYIHIFIVVVYNVWEKVKKRQVLYAACLYNTIAADFYVKLNFFLLVIFFLWDLWPHKGSGLQSGTNSLPRYLLLVGPPFCSRFIFTCSNKKKLFVSASKQAKLHRSVITVFFLLLNFRFLKEDELELNYTHNFINY